MMGSTDILHTTARVGLFLLVVLLCSIEDTTACTTIISGKSASVDGSVMATHSNDGEGTTDWRLVHIPARDYPRGSQRAIYGSPENYPRYVGTERGVSEYFPENCQAGEGNCDSFEAIGYIPQVRHTFSYKEGTYGVINEKQVAIGESTCSGVYAAKAVGSGGQALLSVDQLSYIAMERASSSREAVQIMGDLAVEYGFYGASSSFEGGAESLMVTDKNEGFVFHVLADPTGTSAIWVAARVPDDSIAVVANMFSVREVNLSDTRNFLGRQDMWELAEREGLWAKGEPMDFTATFSDGEYAHKYYSGRRMWGVFRLLAPSQNLSPTYGNLKEDAPYPFAVPVDAKITPKDLMTVHRDWYNGTQYSPGEGNIAGGAFGSPDRYNGGSGESQVEGNWERTIAIFRSSDSYVVQSRAWLPDEVGGIVWFGPYAAHGTVYVPIMAGMEVVPSCLTSGFQGVFDLSKSFWAFRIVENLAQIKFEYIIQNIRAAQDALESNSQQLVNSLSEAYAAGEIDLDVVSDKLASNADLARSEFVSLFYGLLFTYADGWINQWKNGRFTSSNTGYPAWWLEQVGYANGPPPVEQTEMMKQLGINPANPFAKPVQSQQSSTKIQVIGGMDIPEIPKVYVPSEHTPVVSTAGPSAVLKPVSFNSDASISATAAPRANMKGTGAGCKGSAVATVQGCLLECARLVTGELEDVQMCADKCLHIEG